MRDSTNTALPQLQEVMLVKKILSILVAMLLTMSLTLSFGTTVSAYETVFDTPNQLKNGDTMSYEDVGIGGWGSIRIKASADGKISIKYTTTFGYLRMKLLDEDGATVKVNDDDL